MKKSVLILFIGIWCTSVNLEVPSVSPTSPSIAVGEDTIQVNRPLRKDGADRVVIGKGQTIAEDEETGDVVTISGTTILEGSTRGDLVTIKGDVRIGKNAQVKGDLVCILGNIFIEKGGQVKGDTTCIAGTINDPGKGIQGNTVSITGPWSTVLSIIAGTSWIMFAVWIKVLSLIAFLLLSYLVVALMPQIVERVGNQAARNPFISGCVGAGAIVAFPVLFLVLLITLVGILLVPLVYFVCGFIGLVGVAYIVGARVRNALRGNSQRPFLDVTIGILLITLVTWIPVVGALVKFLLILIGLGALILTRFGKKDGIGTVPVTTSLAAPVGNVD